jgi:amino acid transporter
LLIINGMIGGGIFGVPAEAARLAGAFSPWVFAICALLQLPILLCFAQLASYFTGTGGPALYAGTAFGPIVGFQTGWCLYIARLLAFAANVNLLVDSLAYLLGGAIGSRLRVALLFVACGLLSLANAAGVRGAMHWLGGLTVLKFVPLIALVLFGLLMLHPNLHVTMPVNVHGLGAATLLVIYVYTGFESGLVVAGEARDPKRDVPRALLVGLSVSAGLYVLIQAVSVAALPGLASSARPLVDVGGVLMGPWGALLLTAAATVSVAGNLFGSMFSTPRITYRLALDGQLPSWFGAVHPIYKTPVSSIAFFGAACFLIAASSGFVWLASLSVVTRLLLWLVCIAAIPRLKNRFADTQNVVRLAGGYSMPVLAAVVCLALMSQVKPLAYASVAGLLAVGSLLFVAGRRRQQRAGAREGPPRRDL